MSQSEKEELDFLGKQYRRLLKRLRDNEKIIKIKEKCFYIVCIAFVFTFSAASVLIYKNFKSIIFKLVGIICELINTYVYIFFLNNYVEESVRESDQIVQEINNICNKINSILIKNKINEDSFYKELEQDIIQ